MKEEKVDVFGDYFRDEKLFQGYDFIAHAYMYIDSSIHSVVDIFTYL
jgi:hypothetical protein